MQVSRVSTTNPEVDILVQGFRSDEKRGFEPYVFIGAGEDDGWVDIEAMLTPENAHILSEEIRKHAEFAATAADKGE